MADYDLYDCAEPSLSGVERSLYDAVSREEPWALVERFAALERVSGSADEARAAGYVCDRLDALGIDYDRHEPSLYLSIPETATLRVADESEPADETEVSDSGDALAPGESFDAVKTVAFGGGEAAGEVVPVDGGFDAGSGVDDLLGAELDDLSNVAGNVALLSGVLPIEAVEELAAAGAAGVIVQHAHEREPHEGIATPVWGGAPTPRSDVAQPEIPILTVARPVGERLRAAAADGDGPTVDVRAETTTEWRSCPLVEARIEGEAAATDDFVLLHGHYDSWHVGVADNATGDAALLELARVFADHADDLRRNLRVCWWPGHSTGRYAGSTWYADQRARTLRERCVAHVNVDSPGSVDATEFEDMVVWMPEADGLCRGAIRDTCGKTATENRPPRAGDYSFDNLGVTGAFMLSSNIPREVRAERGYHAVGGCGGHSDAWHLTTDTLDKADPDVLVRDVRVYATAVARLLRTQPLPLDHRDTLARHGETLAEYADATDFDLAPVRSALAATTEAVEAFYDAVDAGEVDAATTDETIRALSRPLVRVNFTTEGQFEHDPAYDRPPYPGLAPATELDERAADERRHHRVALRRQRTRAVALLEQAREIAERATP
ncbi:M28 family metallopeptidase [Halobaculum sp. MBLA0147]|uniref:M28 family metallopeptidase n=1 Tax=Halobaculum sp. MBLA0147 TaxID=3079934 RepID=UPI0035242F61